MPEKELSVELKAGLLNLAVQFSNDLSEVKEAYREFVKLLISDTTTEVE